jgi:hypothetical protein
VVSGGRVEIKLNEEPGNFFRTYKGVRQGDTFSPLLFNLVVDALATIVDRSNEARPIRGFITDLVEGG